MANTYSVQPDVEITIETIGSDLVIQGHPDAEIRARGDDPDVHIEDDGQRVVITCSGDCRLDVPSGAQLRIGSVGNDARITDLSSSVEIETVGNDLTVRDSGEVKVGSVGSDLKIKRIRGSVEAETVGSDAVIREIDGEVKIDHIGSDARLTEITGSCEVESVGSDLMLNIAFRAGSHYHFGHVGNDVLARVQPETNVRFEVPYHAQKSVEVRGARIENDDDVDYIILGSGAVTVKVEHVGNEVTLVTRDRDFAEFAFEASIPDNLDEFISAQVNAQLAGIQGAAERVAEQMRAKAEQMAEEIRRNTERAAERAQREAQRASERAQRKYRHGGPWGFEFSWPEKAKRGMPPIPPIPPVPPWPEKPKRKSEPVSNEERLAILRMVENKQITIEEAERLLSALEDND